MDLNLEEYLGVKLKVKIKPLSKKTFKFGTQWSDKGITTRNRSAEMKTSNILNSWKQLVALILVLAGLSAAPAKAAMVAGGAVPLINYYVGFANTGVDVQDANAALATGVFVTLYVNNNSAGGWTLTFTAKHGGWVKMGAVAGGTGVGDRNIFTALDYNAGTALGTCVLGAGGTAAVPTAFSTLLPASTVTHVSAAQTTATVDYAIDIRGTWLVNSGMLAGFYEEEITVGLVAIM